MWNLRILALSSLLAASLTARDWLIRTYEIPLPGVTMAAQDTAGFLWVGSGEGLYRFDGSRFQRWAPEVFGLVNMVVAGAAGEIFVLPSREAPLYRITASGTVKELEPVSGVTADSAGRIWIAREDGLYVHDREASWRKESDRFWDGHHLILYPAQSGSIFVTTDTGMWRARSGLPAVKIWNSRHMVNPLETSDGDLYVSEEGTGTSSLYRVRGESKRGQSKESKSQASDSQESNSNESDSSESEFREKLLSWRGRYCFMLERAGSVWIFADGVSAVVRPGLRLEILRPDERIRLGAGVLVDREGSLWTSRPAGLSVVPEPDTEIWTEADGLHGPGAQRLLERPDGVWVSNWTTLFRMKPDGGAWNLEVQPVVHYGQLCEDREGTLWTQHPWRNGRFEKLFIENWVCAPSADGAVWLGSARLYHTPSPFGPPRQVRIPQSLADLEGVLEDSRGRLWITSNENICSRPAAAALADKGSDWACTTLPNTKELWMPVELPGGSIWIRAYSGGFWRFDGRSWQPVRGWKERLNELALSQRGGVWVLGVEERTRVVEDAEAADGWRILERVNGWQGVPRTETMSALESRDGSLWFATALGLVHVPPHASPPKLPPPVFLTSLTLNGRRREPVGVTDVPPGENQVEVGFAALSFRDRSLLRYQYRLKADALWSTATESEPLFRFINLKSGDYRLEVRASLDGQTWSAVPAALRIHVVAPWYLRWWAFLLLAAAVSAVLYAAHRARVGIELRMERQRARIAMDLHDEIGSGLGSIGILSNLAASDQVNEQQRRDFATRIAQTSGDLGLALSDIVWSLRPDSDTVEALAAQLSRHGDLLFPGTRPEFLVRFPEFWPVARLSLPVRRSLLLIGQEALHNAARHSRAGTVRLVFEEHAGCWSMQVEDDGCGIHPPAFSGMGLANMKQRAGAIGAEIEFKSRPGAGTSVKVRFKAGAASGAPC